MTTLKDVAKVAGVSRATVSLVCRESPLVAEKTRKKVERAMAEVGYVYNRSAANLRSSQSNTVGLIIPDIANPVYADLLTGIEDVLEAIVTRLPAPRGDVNAPLKAMLVDAW